ncbi:MULTISPECIES: NAD-dependent epimerase/dehydratase family protein [Bacillus cereus group]|uniref:NAD-dependent epimerase/dehydratase family protein n=1 Tax=Bacillus pseudomycoides TaxID=64104 RepID=A0AAJ1YV24_9BACI|nr:NAD-dependent epimerase/dehydratase family protein [Bacillus cereus group sp. N21]MDR4189955.1 NAD-dependent epimerase/dehydratase family protein [Bacillus pseudomycoides]MDR4324675.1 NAD-dependent epimerase/dehydratase family protein [Bacillus pseudomycoides]
MILVIGSAGYIGSHVVKELLSQKHRAVIKDFTTVTNNDHVSN